MADSTEYLLQLRLAKLLQKQRLAQVQELRGGLFRLLVRPAAQEDSGRTPFSLRATCSVPFYPWACRNLAPSPNASQRR